MQRCEKCNVEFEPNPFPCQDEDGAYEDNDMETKCLDFMESLPPMKSDDGEIIMENWEKIQQQYWNSRCRKCWLESAPPKIL